MMKKIINGIEREVQILGGFEIDELGKKYIICTYDDDKKSNNELVMIYEINANNNIVSIPNNEKDLVLHFYKLFKESLIGGE